jgi:membrane-bound serine protease (ClpP class)
MWWCHLLLGVPLAIAGLFLFLPWTTALPVALTLSIGTAVIAYYSARALRQPPVTGKEALLGKAGEAVSDLNPEGLVRVGGELWVAKAPEPIGKGTRVRVQEVHGAKMRVQPWGS